MPAPAPVPYFEFFDKTSILDDRDIPGIVAKRQKYLGKAYELQPDNLKLSMLYLQQLAELKSDSFEKTWQVFNEKLSPLIVSADLEVYETKQRELVAQVNDALESKDWKQILLGVRRLGNLVKRGEVQQIDLARVQPYELEFLRTELDQRVVSAVAKEETKNEPVAVKFDAPSLIKSDNKVSMIRVLDYDLDHELEIAALSDNELVVYKKSKDGDWVPDSRTPLAKKYTGLLAADLDYDTRTVGLKKRSDEANQDKASDKYSDPDFVFYGPEGVDVFENKVDAEGNRSLELIQPGDLAKISGALAATLVDIDHDKDLDLVVAGNDGFKLFLSRGNLSFYDFSEHSVFPTPNRR